MTISESQTKASAGSTPDALKGVNVEIKEVVEVVSHIVETDEKEWPTYRRDGPESWSRLMGEAWEPVFYCDIIEKEYQRHLYMGN